MSIYKKWAEKEYSIYVRISATMAAGTLFVILLPLFFLKAGATLDMFWNLPGFDFGFLNKLTGWAAILIGFYFALWSILSQIQSGRGTPIPAMATQKLLINGPFKYCRNPMGFGTILAYFGLAILMASISILFLAAIFTLLFILYIKLLEEKELIERFGESYLEYMRSSAFIIPKFR